MTSKESRELQSSGYVLANGLQIYYESVGSGKPLVLLHGGTLTLQMWNDLLPQFSPHFKVIMIDSRGHGKTNNPSGQITYRLMADDVAEFIREAGLEKPLICGFSDGGQIGLELGMNYPGVAQAYVLGGVYGKLTERVKLKIAEMGIEGSGLVNFEYIRSHMPGVAEYWKASHAQEDDPERWQTLLRQLSECWWAPLGYTQNDYQRIHEPTLIILGDRDEFITVEEAALMYGQLPNAELAVIPNANHMQAIGSESVFTRIAIDYLKRRSSSY